MEIGATPLPAANVQELGEGNDKNHDISHCLSELQLLDEKDIRSITQSHASRTDTNSIEKYKLVNSPAEEGLAGSKPSELAERWELPGDIDDFALIARDHSPTTAPVTPQTPTVPQESFEDVFHSSTQTGITAGNMTCHVAASLEKSNETPLLFQSHYNLPFRGLPQEILDIVYSLCLTLRETIDISEFMTETSFPLMTLKSCRSVKAVTLLYVNHQVHADATRILYSKNTFTFCFGSVANIFLEELPEYARHQIRHIALRKRNGTMWPGSRKGYKEKGDAGLQPLFSESRSNTWFRFPYNMRTTMWLNSFTMTLPPKLWRSTDHTHYSCKKWLNCGAKRPSFVLAMHVLQLLGDGKLKEVRLRIEPGHAVYVRIQRPKPQLMKVQDIPIGDIPIIVDLRRRYSRFRFPTSDQVCSFRTILSLLGIPSPCLIFFGRTNLSCKLILTARQPIRKLISKFTWSGVAFGISIMTRLCVQSILVANRPMERFAKWMKIYSCREKRAMAWY
jgi:hypothetical protein